MLSSELINHNIPQLRLQDTVVKAKQLINDYKLTHLPVVADNLFLGYISEEDLLDVEDEKIPVELIQEHFLKGFIYDDVHFLNAVQFCNQYETNIVSVVNRSHHFMGVITTTELLKCMGDFAGANEIGGIIILEMERIQFSISEISRIVESNNCTILHLNTTTHPNSGILSVTLHLNRKEISSIVSAFERYEYQIKYHFGDQIFEDKTDANYRNFMNYLNI